MSAAEEVREMVAPGRLWSLWDMQRFYVHQIVELARELTRLTTALKGEKLDNIRGAELLDNEIKFLQQDIPTFHRLGLDMCVAHANRMIEKFQEEPRQIRAFEAIAMYDEMINRLEDQCKLRYTVNLQPFALDLLEPKRPLFGDCVHDRFPLANYDIQEAASCLAFERATASVMHCMRVLEVGLKSLAKSIGINYAPSWDAYIRKIHQMLSENSKNLTKKTRERNGVLSEIAGDLLAVKHAWRNPSMHFGGTYSIEDALSIFKLTRTLMGRLASDLSLKAVPNRLSKRRSEENLLGHEPQNAE